MGFLKRLFSMGGKKNTKSRHNKDAPPLPSSKRGSATFNTVAGAPYPRSSSALNEQAQDEEENEAAVHRLLRSSSARYAVAHEVDYSNLPPMPHPINAVLSAQSSHQVYQQPTGHSTLAPSASTVSLSSVSLNTRQQGGYNVTVYRKQRLSQGPEEVLATEKKKNRDSAHLNANDSRVLKLRSEPSLVSLVSLYDEQGQLPEGVFSNNDASDEVERQPPKKAYREVPLADEDDDDKVVATGGKAQCRRSGSTLRQLLGASTDNKPADASEGDISWAERFLGELETSSISTHSSFALSTPNSEQGPPFAGEDISYSTEMTVDNPAISSMNVELSISTSASQIFGEDEEYLSSSFQRDIKKVPSNDSTLTKTTQKAPSNRPSSNTLGYKSSTGPGTPQKRASQVFEFIKKRASKFVEKDERNLPDPPIGPPSSPGYASQGKDDSEDEVDRQLRSRASSQGSCASRSTKGRASSSMAPPSFVEADLDTTPTMSKESRKLSTRAMSDFVQNEGNGMDQIRGLVKRFSINIGASTRGDTGGSSLEDEERDQVPQDLPAIATQQQHHLVLETPMKPAADADKANQERDIRVLMTGPTKVIVTAPTPGTANHVQTGYSLNRVPRGPRGPGSRRRTSGSGSREAEREERRRIRAEREKQQRRAENREAERERERKSSKSADKYKQGLTTNMISTPMKKVPSRTFSGGRARSSSVSSTGSNGDENHYNTVYAEAKRFVEGGHGLGKPSSKGTGSLGVKSDIPLTPLRTSRRTSVNMGIFDPPTQQENRATKAEKRSSRDREKGLYALPGSRSGGSSTRNHRL
ncbi:hypothetical protein EST38_g1983 [Candolleomyces aberdarensis]|uniref:Uncharacterized protein n=1 Tax=Candolleomyces aberdarensis TaxID=2316362 RepID=A0A4Q2DVS2_9AGAR|nr:hypothetical protein EST38_g1983 [Candolleomyces aberdarensis]